MDKINKLKKEADRIVFSTLEQVYLRDEDKLLILRPNKLYFANATALYLLKKLYSPDYHIDKINEYMPFVGNFISDKYLSNASNAAGNNGGAENLKTESLKDKDRKSSDFEINGIQKNNEPRSVDIERIISEAAAFYKISEDRITDDLLKLMQTLSSLLASQSSVAYVDNKPTPSLKMTDFLSHELYYPVLSEIALTYRCQLKCKFCYAGVGGYDADELMHAEMNIGQIKSVITKISDEAKCPTISFTGGEPTIRFDELCEAVSFAKARGMRTNLITNGIILSDKTRCQRLKNAGLDSAQVSIEGAGPEIHDGITCLKGAFEKSICAVKNLKEIGIHVHTNSTITTENVESVYKLPPILADIGLKYFSVNMVIKTGNANINEELLINYSAIGEKIKRLAGIAEANGIKLVWYSPTPYCLFNPVEAGLGSKSCAAASGLLSVSPSGEVLPCSSFKNSLGNLLTSSFKNIWDSKAAKYFRNKKFIPPTCGKCDIKDICQGGCPLYWDAVKDFKEIEKCPQSLGKTPVKNMLFKLKRKLNAPKYGI